MANKQTNRRKWAKLNVPDELGDLVAMVAKKGGWDSDQIHWFIFDAVRARHPELTERALNWLGRKWIEEDELKPRNPPEEDD
jgi:3-oxoacyl-[acyl-carrier-protein] synthase III